MVEMVVSETRKHVDRLEGLQKSPSIFLGARAGNRQWPPQSIQYFKANKFSKAYFYRFLAALTYIAYQCPQKSTREAFSSEKSIKLPFLHEIMSRTIFEHVKAVLHCQTDGEEAGKEDSAGCQCSRRSASSSRCSVKGAVMSLSRGNTSVSMR